MGVFAAGLHDGIQVISQKTKLEWSQESAQEGCRSGSGTRSVVIIQWEVCHGGWVGSLEVKSVSKITQIQM